MHASKLLPIKTRLEKRGKFPKQELPFGAPYAVVTEVARGAAQGTVRHILVWSNDSLVSFFAEKSQLSYGLESDL